MDLGEKKCGGLFIGSRKGETNGGRGGEREGARRIGGLKQKTSSGYLGSRCSCGSFVKCPDEAPALTRLPHGEQRHLEKGGAAGPE